MPLVTWPASVKSVAGTYFTRCVMCMLFSF